MASPRAYWKGYLKLSLVTCPVAMYPASSQSEKTRFHQINRKTGNRLRQQMVDEKTGRVVEGTTRRAATNSNVAAMLRLSRKNWRPLKSRAHGRSTSISSCPRTRSTSDPAID
jgi:non-homologous end joining protein Ku